MVRTTRQGRRSRQRLRTLLIGSVATGLVGLGAAASAEAAGDFNCRATGLTLGGMSVPNTVANPAYTPCPTEKQIAAFPANVLLPPGDPGLTVQSFYARTERGNRWVQAYSALDVIQLGTTDGPHILIENAESSATASCVRTTPKLVTNGGVTDVHIRRSAGGPRETIVNVDNSYSFVTVPGLGKIEFNKTEHSAGKIQRTAAILSDSMGTKRVEIAKSEAGITGNPCT